MEDVLNAEKWIYFADDALVEFSKILDCANCAVLFGTNKSGHTPFCLPATLQDADRLLAFHLAFVSGNVMDQDMVRSLDVARRFGPMKIVL